MLTMSVMSAVSTLSIRSTMSAMSTIWTASKMSTVSTMSEIKKMSTHFQPCQHYQHFQYRQSPQHYIFWDPSAFWDPWVFLRSKSITKTKTKSVKIVKNCIDCTLRIYCVPIFGIFYLGHVQSVFFRLANSSITLWMCTKSQKSRRFRTIFPKCPDIRAHPDLSGRLRNTAKARLQPTGFCSWEVSGFQFQLLHIVTMEGYPRRPSLISPEYLPSPISSARGGKFSNICIWSFQTLRPTAW